MKPKSASSFRLISTKTFIDTLVSVSGTVNVSEPILIAVDSGTSMVKFYINLEYKYIMCDSTDLAVRTSELLRPLQRIFLRTMKL